MVLEGSALADLGHVAPETVEYLNEVRCNFSEPDVHAARGWLEERGSDAFLDPEARAGLVGKVWRDVLDRRPARDEVLLAISHMVLQALTTSPDLAARSLQAVGYKAEMSRLYMLFMLGSTLHDLGRSAQAAGDHTAAQTLFAAELEAFQRLRPESERLSSDTRYRMLGMGAVAQAFLARTQEYSKEELEQARRDLLQSVKLGNDPEQAHIYLFELDARLYDFFRDQSYLKAGLIRARRHISGGLAGRGSLLGAAELCMRMGDHEMASLATSDELREHHRTAALEAYSNGRDFLNAARVVDSEDSASRLRLELLLMLSEEKLDAASTRTEGSGFRASETIASIQAIGLRVPQTFREFCRGLIDAGDYEAAATALERAVDASRTALRAEPSAEVCRQLAGFLRLHARVTKDPDSSVEALELLDQAIALGDASPENHTLSAAECLRLWKIERSAAYFAKAVSSACTASLIAPAWAWPLILLADLAREAERCEPLRDGSWRKAISADVREHELVELVHLHQTSELMKMAANRAISFEYSNTRNLGGRSEAYVLEDPHGLIEELFVIKPGQLGELEWEVEQTEVLIEFIDEHNLPNWLGTPETVGVFTRDGEDALAVTIREGGVGLDVLALRSNGVLHDKKLRLATERAVHYLAVSHAAWQGRGPDADHPSRARRDAAAEFRYHLRVLEIGDQGRSSLRRDWLALIPEGGTTTPKRDAHAANWLVARKRIVALDFASKKTRPFLYELAQLVEDFPLVPVSDEGWEYRLERVSQYYGVLASFGFELPPEDAALEIIYGACAVARCLFLLHSTGRGSDSGSTDRASHAVELLQYVSSKFEGQSLGTLAGVIYWQMSAGSRDGALERQFVDDHERMRTSKLLARVLRHRPERYGVTLTEEGWADIHAVLTGLRAGGVDISLDQMLYVITSGEERRFELQGSSLRARYGHSVPISLPETDDDVPAVLFHGTHAGAVSKIFSAEGGLLPLARQHVHLVTSQESALRVGSRRGQPVVLAVDAPALVESGYQLIRASAEVWLADAVPIDFLSFAEQVGD